MRAPIRIHQRCEFNRPLASRLDFNDSFMLKRRKRGSDLRPTDKSVPQKITFGRSVGGSRRWRGNLSFGSSFQEDFTLPFFSILKKRSAASRIILSLLVSSSPDVNATFDKLQMTRSRPRKSSLLFSFLLLLLLSTILVDTAGFMLHKAHRRSASWSLILSVGGWVGEGTRNEATT